VAEVTERADAKAHGEAGLAARGVSQNARERHELDSGPP
jgi:hypothetical protein